MALSWGFKTEARTNWSVDRITSMVDESTTLRMSSIRIWATKVSEKQLMLRILDYKKSLRRRKRPRWCSSSRRCNRWGYHQNSQCRSHNIWAYQCLHHKLRACILLIWIHQDSTTMSLNRWLPIDNLAKLKRTTNFSRKVNIDNIWPSKMVSKTRIRSHIRVIWRINKNPKSINIRGRYQSIIWNLLLMMSRVVRMRCKVLWLWTVKRWCIRVRQAWQLRERTKINTICDLLDRLRTLWCHSIVSILWRRNDTVTNSQRSPQKVAP